VYGYEAYLNPTFLPRLFQGICPDGEGEWMPGEAKAGGIHPYPYTHSIQSRESPTPTQPKPPRRRWGR